MVVNGTVNSPHTEVSSGTTTPTAALATTVPRHAKDARGAEIVGRTKDRGRYPQR